MGSFFLFLGETPPKLAGSCFLLVSFFCPKDKLNRQSVQQPPVCHVYTEIKGKLCARYCLSWNYCVGKEGKHISPENMSDISFFFPFSSH